MGEEEMRRKKGMEGEMEGRKGWKENVNRKRVKRESGGIIKSYRERGEAKGVEDRNRGDDN